MSRFSLCGLGEATYHVGWMAVSITQKLAYCLVENFGEVFRFGELGKGHQIKNLPI